MAERSRPGSALRPTIVWAALQDVIGGADTATDDSAGSGRGSAAASGLDVIDVGGGTGGFAVPLARLGHQVTVVDPSPDALASLERRAGEAGVQVKAVQGDAYGLLDVVPPGSADLVLCHGVLEHVDDLVPSTTALAGALRHDGTLSVLAANRNAAVLARALAGHFAQARRALDDPDGRWGAADPLPRRFTEQELVALLVGAGLSVVAVHGVRGFADLVSGALVDSDAGAAEALQDLEAATADLADFRAIAGQLHVLAVRG